uniref:Phosphoribosylamine--glycine ligase n=1 Tax=Candidatus Methanogaster sp. ANME-2c ERB4 TaxID=2759911 RepID=A0A7G9Y8K4_9EURY|nr:phosphoribosylamine--glycine ligase [Methanosarcinales archaeon ANME-2c ERB4]QNO45801.1 phosphoribosylamine--glycine ligase [Methanosarcinales archaeon ANME-2c ERB4]
MKILLVGGGGREHVIAEAVARSTRNPELYAVMSRKNPGIARLCKDFLIANEDVESVLPYAELQKIDFAVIGPEAPLGRSLADRLEEKGIPCLGPRCAPAQIELDKAWARTFMRRHNIEGCPAFEVFDCGETASAHAAIDELGDVAIKPTGLTGGKGVKVMGDHFDIEGAKEYVSELLDAGSVVIEENLKGEEFTVQAFSDGETLAFAPAVQDHKRAYDGDKGPNTGSMGSYSDAGNLLPFMREEDYEAAKRIMQDTVRSIKKDVGAYKGILYGQFMLTATGIKVIEFNARFGDPEAMNVIPLLKTDFVDILSAIADESLSNLNIEFERLATVCKYAVPAGYPERPTKDSIVEIDDEGTGDALIFYSSVYEKDGQVYTTGSRAIAVVGIAPTIAEAEKIVSAGLSGIHGDLHARSDIGTAALVDQRVRHAASLRGL